MKSLPEKATERGLILRFFAYVSQEKQENEHGVSLFCERFCFCDSPLDFFFEVWYNSLIESEEVSPWQN
jgi:hypothetical protein